MLGGTTNLKLSGGSESEKAQFTGKVVINKANPDAPLDVSTSGGSGTAMILRNTSIIAMQ